MLSDARQCSGKTCTAMIVWRYTPAGKRLPLDAEPVTQPSSYTYVIVDDATCRPSEPLTDAPGTAHYLSHWRTCADVDDFKKGRRS